MRVVFLDVDGVLNSEAFLCKLEARHRQLGHTEPASPKRATTCDCFKLYHQIDRDAVARLNRLIEVTGAKIVISSSWRKLFDPPELHRILFEHGLIAEIIGETPDGYNDPEMLAAFGYIDRIFRGHEIDYWLKTHPEVERFVILDDGSDMEMHKNRLVQTDPEEGLLDDHVELAIRMMSWDGKTIPSPLDKMEVKRMEVKRMEVKRDELHAADGNYVGPGSSWAIHCNHEGCIEALTLSRRTTESPSHDDDYQNLLPALDTAAVLLGWRTYHNVWWCPSHVVEKQLSCARCGARCPACSCMGGPRVDAVEGQKG